VTVQILYIAPEFWRLLAHPDVCEWRGRDTWEATVTLKRLQTILEGARDPALADDPELDYRESAELLLLLERLGTQGSAEE